MVNGSCTKVCPKTTTCGSVRERRFFRVCVSRQRISKQMNFHGVFSQREKYVIYNLLHYTEERALCDTLSQYFNNQK